MLFHSCSQNNRCRVHPQETIVNDKIEQYWNNRLLALAWSRRRPETLLGVSLELSACGDLRRARQHTALHACMCLVLACTSKNMRARGLCGHARRRTRVHEPRPDKQAGEHACTSLVRTRTPKNMRARGLCEHARQGTCVHEARADVHAYERPCIRPLLTCTLASTRAQRRADLHRPRAGLHCRLLASVLAIRLEIRSRISYMIAADIRDIGLRGNVSRRFWETVSGLSSFKSGLG